jgi:hypothetical protein
VGAQPFTRDHSFVNDSSRRLGNKGVVIFAFLERDIRDEAVEVGWSPPEYSGVSSIHS